MPLVRAGTVSSLAAMSRGINRVCRALTVVLLAAIVCSNAAEIVLRSAFSYSLAWIFEVNLLLATWLYFIGICQVYYRKGDISVDVLSNFLPPPVRATWSLIVDLLSVATFAVIGWYGVRLAQVQWPFKTPGVGLPGASYTVPVVLGAAIMIFHVCVQRLQRTVGGIAIPQ